MLDCATLQHHALHDSVARQIASFTARLEVQESRNWFAWYRDDCHLIAGIILSLDSDLNGKDSSLVKLCCG